NPSLIPIEMMACGLPVLDLDTDANRVFYEGVPDALALADPYPVRIATAVEEILDDPERRERLSARGLEYASAHTWEKSAKQVEDAFRSVLG
ncbi:MAG: glycosyltransferase family protein, partial [Actinomycetota bacterium]